MEFKPWTAMYAGAGASVIICFALLYIITASRNVGIEWMVWVFFGITLVLMVAGFLYESDYKRKHRGEELSRFRKIVEGEA